MVGYRGEARNVLEPNLHGLTEGTVRFLTSHLFLVVRESRFVYKEGRVTAGLDEALGRHAVCRESK